MLTQLALCSEFHERKRKENVFLSFSFLNFGYWIRQIRSHLPSASIYSTQQFGINFRFKVSKYEWSCTSPDPLHCSEPMLILIFALQLCDSPCNYFSTFQFLRTLELKEDLSYYAVPFTHCSSVCYWPSTASIAMQ